MKSSAALFLLFLLFLGLKLSGEITWSWLWVCAPLWGYVALTFGIGFVQGFGKAYRAKVKERTLKRELSTLPKNPGYEAYKTSREQARLLKRNTTPHVKH